MPGLPRGLSWPLAAFALGATLIACADPEPSPDEARSVYGIVRDAISGGRLKGVAITLRSDTLDEVSGKTNGDGAYDLVIASDALHGRLEAKKSGYARRVVSVYFDTDDVQVDVELSRK